jgi:putative ABC transport system permease protein
MGGRGRLAVLADRLRRGQAMAGTFAYRTGLDLWMFAAVSLLALLVAGLTMSRHALRAAKAEPAWSLRYE